MTVPADDWPQWRGLHRDGISRETGLVSQWPEAGLEQRWVREGLGEGFSSPAIAGGTLYITGMDPETSTGTLFAMDLEGAIRWRQDYGPEWTGTHPGTRSTPTLDASRIYLLSGLGVLVCFDKASGAILWKRDVVTDFGGMPPVMGFNESVLIHGDTVFCTPGGADAAVAGINKHTGETLWTTSGLSEQSAYCSPILIDRGHGVMVVTLTAGSLVALRPEDGGLLWRHPVDENEKDQNHSISPVHGDGLLYVTSGHGTGGTMYQLSPTGRECHILWRDALLNPLHGGVVLLNGFLFGSNSRGRWVCLSAESGELQYEDRGIGRGSLISAEGLLYCYGENGKVALVKATPEIFALVSSFEITQGSGQHWAHPVIAGKHLYVRHGDALMAFKLQQK